MGVEKTPRQSERYKKPVRRQSLAQARAVDFLEDVPFEMESVKFP